MKINTCPISGSNESIEYLNLGDIPLVNNLCNTREESLDCKKYPLVVQLFPESGLSCLTEVIPKEELFGHYLYKSGVNSPYLVHCSDMYDYLEKYTNLEEGGTVLDIGGNDGSLLMQFFKKNEKLLLVNIDPCEAFEQENFDKGIVYYPEFFGEATDLVGKADVITSTNVFQHNKGLRSFVKGIYKNLIYDGIWCLEFPYWLTTMITDNYDQVYHEHIYYYRLKNINDILLQEGMKIINVSYHNIHAGTLRVISAKADSSFDADSSVQSFLNLESFMTESFYTYWGMRIDEKICDFKGIVKGYARDRGNIIIGFGACAKGCVFLNTCELDDLDILYVIDDTPEKQGKFIPGTGIEIVSREILKTVTPDYILILAHNFRDYIIDSLLKDGYKGKFIVMFPEIQII